MSVAHAAFTQSVTIVTAYDTLGLDGLRASLKQTASRAIFVDAILLVSLTKVLADVPSLEFVIVNHTSTADVETKNFRDRFPHIRLLSYSELKQLGEEQSCQACSTATGRPCLRHVHKRVFWSSQGRDHSE
jgi:long-chain acyl-CoA synthetase